MVFFRRGIRKKIIFSVHQRRNRGVDFKREGCPLASLTSSCRKRSLAMCTIRSTWMIPPMLFTSTSDKNVRTRIASTRSCRYSGWGTWFSTDSTCTANLISQGVIWRARVEMEIKNPQIQKTSSPHIPQALKHTLLSSRGGSPIEVNKMFLWL